MATGVPGTAQRLIALGTTVRRATSTLPATASLTIFNVAGGKIMLTSLIGEVTTVIQAQATTVVFNHTVGATTTALSTVGDINAAIVGSVVALSGGANASTATQVGAAAGADCNFALGIGALKYTTGATSTGAIKWTLTYIPIDDGATVTAA